MIRDFVKQISKNFEKNKTLLQVVVGPRQVGKTFGVKQILETWQGVKKYETADLLSPPDVNWIISNWKSVEQDSAILVLDEIQKIPNWAEAVKLLFDNIRNKIDFKVVILGSASLSIQQGLNESLAGRFELIKVPHWGFLETNEIHKMNIKDFVYFGGYPESYRYLDDLNRWQNFMQFSIIEPVMSRDIFAARRINKPALFKQSLELILRNPAKEISLQKILGQLQDNGNITTIQSYLNLLEEAFLIKQLYKYSKEQIRKRTSSPKILPLCGALSNAFLRLDMDPTNDLYGHLFEACVGAALSNFGGSLYYWREGNFEVDFVWENHTKLYAIEVKSGKRKNSASLGKFLKLYPKAKPVVINEENILDFFKKGSAFFE